MSFSRQYHPVKLHGFGLTFSCHARRIAGMRGKDVPTGEAQEVLEKADLWKPIVATVVVRLSKRFHAQRSQSRNA
jgi:hypothetical protein